MPHVELLGDLHHNDMMKDIVKTAFLLTITEYLKYKYKLPINVYILLYVFAIILYHRFILYYFPGA